MNITNSSLGVDPYMDLRVRPPYGVYSFTFGFEDAFHFPDAKSWMQRNYSLSVYSAGMYLLVIFSLKGFMTTRPRFVFRKPLIVWNTLLAVFSILGALRTAPEMVFVLRNYGLKHSCCATSFLNDDKVCSFWTFMFVLSKIPELGDTLFVVLRKAPLIFLHWYHHSTVLVYSWYSYRESTSVARWFVVMNYSVHALMYSYYALRAGGVRLPKVFPMMITTLQILQMFAGFLVNSWSLQYLNSGTPCRQTRWSVTLALLMYCSYLALFLHFFVKAYVYKKRSPMKEKEM